MRSARRYQPSSSHATNTSSTSDYVSSKHLPHLPRGVRVPKLHSSQTEKPLPQGEWQEHHDPQQMQLMAPGQQGGGRRELQPFHAGASRVTQKTQDEEPAPIFASQPKRSLTLKRPSKVQQQIYRMSGGIEPVDLLCDRLHVWQLAIKDLAHLFKNIIDVESKLANGYASSNKPLSIPFRESNNQFLQSGGVQDVWIAYRNYTVEKSMMHHEYVGYLKSAVVPSLMNLDYDVRNFIKSIEKDPCLRASILYNVRQDADSMVSQLDSAIKYVYHSPDLIAASDDPALLNLGVIQAFQSLYNAENNLHENVIQLQREAATVEQRIYGSLKIITKNWEDFCLENRMDARTIVNKVTSTFDNIQPNSDWNEFVRRNQFQLVNEKAKYKTDEDMNYTNQSNDLCIPTKVNFLNRKTAFKKWKEGLYVLTPCGYLHGFKNARHFETAPLSPELSIFLPQTTVSSTDALAEDLCFQIEGRKRTLGGQKSFIFQANDESDLADWYSEAQRLSQVNDEHQVMEMEFVPPALPGMEPHERQEEYTNSRLVTAGDDQRLIDQGDEEEEPTMDSSDDDNHYDNNLSTAAVLPDVTPRQKAKSPLSKQVHQDASPRSPIRMPAPGTPKSEQAVVDDDMEHSDFVQRYNDKLSMEDEGTGGGGSYNSSSNISNTGIRGDDSRSGAASASGSRDFTPKASRIKEVL